MPEQEVTKTEQTECRPLVQTLKEGSVRFMTETSLHGVHKVTQTERHWIIRALWLLAVLAMGSWLLYTLTYQFKRYLSYPHVTSATVSQGTFVHMPAVSVCLKDPLDRQRLASLPEASLIEQFVVNRDALNWSDTHVLQVMSSVTMEEVMETSSFSAQEVLADAPVVVGALTTSRVEVGVLDMLLNGPVVRCFTFTTVTSDNKTNETLMMRMTDSLVLYMRVPQSTIIHFGDVGGLTVVVHQPWELPLSGKYSDVAFGTAVTLTFSVTQFQFLPAPYRSMGGQDCVDIKSESSRSRLRYFDTYSSASCVWEHSSLAVAKKCLCKSLGDVGSVDLPNCTLLQLHQCYYPELRTLLAGYLRDRGPCLWECQFTLFETKTTAVPFPSPGYEDLRKKLGKKAVNLTTADSVKLRVMYETDMVVTTKHVPAVTLDDIYSLIGGQMGLFLGASLLTIIELLEHFSFELWIIAKYLHSRRAATPSH